MDCSFTEDELIGIFEVVIEATNNAKWTDFNKREFYKRMETIIQDECKSLKKEPQWEIID